MENNLVLGLDLSTSCTGYALMDMETKELHKYGVLKSSSKGMSKLGKLEKTLEKMERLAADIEDLVLKYSPKTIVIEEIAGSKNRLGQKTLDGFHWVVLRKLRPFLNKIQFYDVTGASGWRTHLRLKMSDADKAQNKEAKKLNKKLAKGTRKLPIIGPKHLSCRYVNKKFNLFFDVDENVTDADVCDAIAMTDAFCMFTDQNKYGIIG